MRMITLISLIALLFSSLISRVSSENICQIDDFALGKWEFNNNLTEKSFICCSEQTVTNDKLLNLCRHIRFEEKDCTCDIQGNTVETLSQREKWIWKTQQNCEQLAWKASSFCEYLGKRILLLIGDSLTLQTYVVLRGLLRGRDCFSQVKIELFHYYGEHNRTLVDVMQKHNNADIAIINVGVWYHYLDNYIGMIYNMASDIRKLREDATFRKMKFIWRTIIPPHYDCKSFTNPTNNPLILGNASNDKYLWGWVPTFDTIAVQMMHREAVDILNMYPLYFRPDGHLSEKDCLHYCQPGPLNLFGTILHHYLYHDVMKSGKHSKVPCYATSTYYHDGQCRGTESRYPR